MRTDSLSSPHRRAQTPFAQSQSLIKQLHGREELDSWSALFQRHRFLLTALALLAFLCTIYLYFAITLGASASCSGLTGSEKAACSLGKAKFSHIGKLKFFWPYSFQSCSWKGLYSRHWINHNWWSFFFLFLLSFAYLNPLLVPWLRDLLFLLGDGWHINQAFNIEFYVFSFLGT